MSTLTLNRTQKLFDKQWVPKPSSTTRGRSTTSNVAAVAEAERRIAAAKLPNRSDPIDAAAASVEAGRHSLEQAEKNLDKRKVFAPAGGTIEEVYFRPGEVVNAGQAVVALLPPGNLKVRFFVQEPVRADSSIDQTISVACDGCKGELTAKISFIARDAEFTPPVIFSREQRQKLVYLVEARPAGATAKLTAGQPVTVSLDSRRASMKEIAVDVEGLTKSFGGPTPPRPPSSPTRSSRPCTRPSWSPTRKAGT